MANMVTYRWWFCLQQKQKTARKVKITETKMAARQRTKTTKNRKKQTTTTRRRNRQNNELKIVRELQLVLVRPSGVDRRSMTGWRGGGGLKNVNGGGQTAEACVAFRVAGRIAFPLSASAAVLFVSGFPSSLMPPPTLPRPHTPPTTNTTLIPLSLPQHTNPHSPHPPTHTAHTYIHPPTGFLPSTYGKPDKASSRGRWGGSQDKKRSSRDQTTGGEQQNTPEKRVNTTQRTTSRSEITLCLVSGSGTTSNQVLNIFLCIIKL